MADVDKKSVLKLAEKIGLYKEDMEAFKETLESNGKRTIDYGSPELPLPNGRNILNFIRYSILSGIYNSSAVNHLLSGREEKFRVYVSKSFDYSRKASGNRVRGVAQRILDKFLLIN